MPGYSKLLNLVSSFEIPGAGVRWGDVEIPRDWVNDDWVKREPDWRRFYLCYRGGTEFLDSKSPIMLYSHAREDAESYLDRCKRAYYRNHCRAVVGLKADAIYQPQVLRGQTKAPPPGEKPKTEDEEPQPRVKRAQAGDQDFETFLKDVDGKGTNADPFWNEVARWSMAIGVEWVGIAMSPAPEDAPRDRPMTVQEAQAARVRPYFYRVHATSVIDWDFDERGELAYAVVLRRELRREPLRKVGPNSKQEKPKPRLLACVLTKTEEIRYEIGPRNGQVEVGRFPHNFGAVPLVPVTVSPDWLSQLEDIARMNIEVFNLDSMITEQIARQTFNQLLASVNKPEEFKNTVTGTDALVVVGPGESMTYLAPNVQTVETIQKRAQELEDSIWSMANLRSRPGARGSQPAVDVSGVAYAFEHKNAETDLSNLATRLEEAEQKLGVMRARALGLEPEGFTVQYPREFDIRALMARAAEAMQALKLGLGPTAEAAILKQLARKFLPRLAAGQLEVIDREIDERAKKRAEMADAAAAAGKALADGKADGRETNRPPDQSRQPPGKGAGEDRVARSYKVGDEIDFDLDDEPEPEAKAA